MRRSKSLDPQPGDLLLRRHKLPCSLLLARHVPTSPRALPSLRPGRGPQRRHQHRRCGPLRRHLRLLHGRHDPRRHALQRRRALLLLRLVPEHQLPAAPRAPRRRHARRGPEPARRRAGDQRGRDLAGLPALRGVQRLLRPRRGAPARHPHRRDESRGAVRSDEAAAVWLCRRGSVHHGGR